MNWRTVDMSRESRRDQFAYFQTLSNPYVGVTVQVDVTELAVWCRERGTSFFLAVLYAAVRAANGVPELRRRIRGDQVVEYDRCPSSHTVALPDGTYCYCSLEVDRPFREFLPYAAAEQERVNSAVSAQRRSQVGTGMRNERIRTYNFPQGRLTDHRVGLTLYRLDAVMNGDLDEVIDALVTADQAERLKQTQEH